MANGCKTGWWYTYPSEKYESQLGWLIIPNIRKNIKCSKPPYGLDRPNFQPASIISSNPQRIKHGNYLGTLKIQKWSRHRDARLTVMTAAPLGKLPGLTWWKMTWHLSQKQPPKHLRNHGKTMGTSLILGNGKNATWPGQWQPFGRSAGIEESGTTEFSICHRKIIRHTQFTWVFCKIPTNLI